jgi:hypothetical protein
MSDDDEKMGTADRGYVAIGRAAARQPTEEEIQRGIDATMREVIRSPFNPNALRAPDNVKVANAGEVTTAGEPKRGSGWQEPAKLESPRAASLRAWSAT